jgi:hypothetical protein
MAGMSTSLPWDLGAHIHISHGTSRAGFTHNPSSTSPFPSQSSCQSVYPSSHTIKANKGTKNSQKRDADAHAMPRRTSSFESSSARARRGPLSKGNVKRQYRESYLTITAKSNRSDSFAAVWLPHSNHPAQVYRASSTSTLASVRKPLTLTAQ